MLHGKLRTDSTWFTATALHALFYDEAFWSQKNKTFSSTVLFYRTNLIFKSETSGVICSGKNYPFRSVRCLKCPGSRRPALPSRCFETFFGHALLEVHQSGRSLDGMFQSKTRAGKFRTHISENTRGTAAITSQAACSALNVVTSNGKLLDGSPPTARTLLDDAQRSSLGCAPALTKGSKFEEHVLTTTAERSSRMDINGLSCTPEDGRVGYPVPFASCASTSCS